MRASTDLENSIVPEISDDGSAENIDGRVMKKDNLKTRISDITTILGNKFPTH
ncbi:MAG: hypothetical protein NPIRA06_20930 [Nitrospirales bacterium]|nr:MAG: hypothetical protein NPIRA06_20930 [Nitrospirales bacterium]